MQPSDDPSGFFPLQDMWSHKEINQVDCSANGEVTSVVYLNNYIFSGHSDGTLKVAAHPCMHALPNQAFFGYLYLI